MNTRTRNKLAAILVFLLLWEILPASSLVDHQFIPRFSAVSAAIWNLIVNGDLSTHIRISLIRAYIGLFVAIVVGLPLGLLLGGWFPRIQQATEPLLELFAQANPVILAHVIIFFLGIGEAAKTFIIAWLCIWPITFSTISGIRTVDPSVLKAARSMGLGRWRLFVQVILPSSAPSIFTGLRLSTAYAFLMLIASEMMGSSNGLGWFVIQSQENYHIVWIFAGATVITFLAVVTDALINLLQNRIAFWSDAQQVDFPGGER